jgi:tetratricopeptide (TPR) repeat protein
VKLGAIDFLQKPLTPEQLRHIVEEIVMRHVDTEPSDVDTKNYAYHLRSAKRALNDRDFETAKRSLRKALHLDDRSAEGFNLAGVVAELSEDFANARRYYAQALRINQDFAPARQNAKRLDELAERGASKEPFSLGVGEIRNAN